MDGPPPILDYRTPADDKPSMDPAAAVAGAAAAGSAAACVAAIPFGELSFGVAVCLALVAGVAGLHGIGRTRRYRLRLERTGNTRGGRAFAWLGVLTAAATVFVGLTLPTMGRAREGANRIKCASNLRQIGQALRQYALDGDGTFPPDFDVLLANSDLWPEAFVCPSNESGAENPSPPLVFGANCDYLYLGDGLNDSAAATRVLALGDPTHHGDDGTNVLFADGMVRFLTYAGVVEALTTNRGTP